MVIRLKCVLVALHFIENMKLITVKRVHLFRKRLYMTYIDPQVLSNAGGLFTIINFYQKQTVFLEM